MVQRRDVLKASLSVCSCATCGALGIGMSGGNTRADGPMAISGSPPGLTPTVCRERSPGGGNDDFERGGFQCRCRTADGAF
jgi:hypothetical protein